MSLKIMCDVHIAFKVVRFLLSKGCHAIHVNNILDGCHTTDHKISNHADQHDYIVLTKDADFKNSHFIKGSPRKLLKISLNNIPTTKLVEILDSHFDSIVKAFQNQTCYMDIGREYIEIVHPTT